MAFGYDEENTGMEPIAAGTYEVYATAYVDKLTQTTRKQMIVMNYKIRSDVEQPNKGAVIQFDNFVNSPKALWRTNALTKATDAFENHHDFGDMAHWANEMLGKPVRVTVKLEPDSKGNEYPQVSSFAKSEHVPMTETPEVKHKPVHSQSSIDEAAKGAMGSLSQTEPPVPNISDDDLPF